MKRDVTVDYQFVEFIPNELEVDTVYISVEYATAVHKCCCGCGNKVVTPLSPGDWKLTYDGESISLHPSIGNWSFDCQSHYWIRQNKVSWAPSWSREEIEAGREDDRLRKARYFEGRGAPQTVEKVDEDVAKSRSVIRRVIDFITSPWSHR